MSDQLSTVLVVDDSAFMRKLISECRVGTENTVWCNQLRRIEAIEQIRRGTGYRHRDIEMPRLEGLQTLEQTEETTAVSYVSAADRSMERRNLRALDRGQSVVRKPSAPQHGLWKSRGAIAADDARS